MTKMEQNQYIKDAWVRGLQKYDNIPEDVGDIYKNWLLTKIQQISAMLVQPAPGQEQQDQEQNEQQGQNETGS